MRKTPLLLAFVLALAASGCARQQQTYYIVDPQTGQPVPVVSQQAAAQLQYPQGAQPQYAQQPAPADQSYRGLYSSSPAYAQQSYAPPAYAQPAPAPAAPAASASQERGLFTSRSSAPRAYAQQPVYAPQYTAPRTGGPYVAAPPVPAARAAPYAAYASAPTSYNPGYTLDSGDKLRIVVFGQDGISNSYLVDASGNVNLPLIGTVPARGISTQQLSRMIADKLKQGYVREPHVSVEVEAYRPFFILGEVTAPGQYAYVANMTAETAIAIAGGFAPRASKKTVELTRNTPGQQMKGEVPLNYPLRPGDTIVVKERWF